MEEKTRLASLTGNLAALPVADQPNVDVLVELDKLQRKQVNWKRSIIILCVSVILFAVIGRWRFDWEVLLILIGVLFVHEFGHFIAMKVFRYRNVRMFFIPFFGAAVTGQNFTAPAWKKIIVFLMGPLPGIFAGIGIGIAGTVMQQPLLTRIGQFAVILNGLNLIPLLPLDGGHVMNAILFSRHYLLDTGFRLLAALSLIGISLLIHDNIIRFLGIMMLFGLTASYRIARATADLRKGGVKAEVGADQMIPVPIASVIIDRLRAGIGRHQSSKLLAQQTLQVFENLAARPPGIAASLGFGSLYVASIVASAFFGLAFLFEFD